MGIPLPDDLVSAFLEAYQPPGLNYRDNPVGWIEEVSGSFLWSKQIEVVESVFKNRYTVVPACHGSGKSYVAARVAAAWLACHEPGEAFVLTTAPTWPQVKAILWREMRRAHAQSKLPGRITLDAEWKIVDAHGNEEIVAIGRKPADHDADGFQGIHAKYVLVILDEACGIPKSLWNGVYSVVTTSGSSVLAIGNPDYGDNEFQRVCSDPAWNVVEIPYSATPASTGENVPDDVADVLVNQKWVDEATDRWGERSPIYQSKVNAKFPEQNEDAAYTTDAIQVGVSAAENREPTARIIALSVDVAREGSDDTVAYSIDHSGCAVVEFVLKTNTLTECAGMCAKWARQYPNATVIVDADGLGAGVYDMLKEQRAKVRAYRAGATARDPLQYVNARSEGHHQLNHALETGRMSVVDSSGIVRSELLSVRRIIDSKGRLGIEAKKDAAKRGIHSPNHVDALMMAAWTLRLGERGRRPRPNQLGKSIDVGGGGGYAV